VSNDSGLYPIILERDLGDDEARLPKLDWVVESYSWTVLGGPEKAKLTAGGTRESLAGLLDLLRCPIIIKDRRGETQWYGYIHEVRVRVETIEMVVSLDSVANRIRVLYTKQVSLENGTGEAAETDWEEDATSIAEYGTRERQISLADVTPAQAVSRRDAALADLATPEAQHVDVSGTGASITLNCRGWFETIGWTYYSQFSGTTATENEATTIQKIGRASYTATTISFADVAGEYQINDSANGLTTWHSGDYITISGTTLNNMQTRVLEVAEDGSQLIVSDQVDNEAAGGSFTVAPSYTKVAQSFVLDDHGEDYFVHTLRIKLRKLADGVGGFPTDDLKVTIKANSGGSPGATLTETTLSPSLLSDDDTDEQWYEFNNDVTAWSPAYELSPLTLYWAIFELDGTPTEACYQIGVDETAAYLAGEAKFWDGSAWVSFPNTGADTPFVFVGAWTLEKIIEMIIAGAEFIEGVTIEDASGQYGYPYRDGDTSALEVLLQLLRTGVAGGRRYLAEVKADRTLRIYQEPVSAGDKDLQRTLARQCLDHKDRVIEPHRLSEIVGRWVRLPAAILDTANAARLVAPSPYFIDKATWSRTGGIDVTPRNTRSIWDNSIGDG
jgi:hypothetical protein